MCDIYTSVSISWAPVMSSLHEEHNESLPEHYRSSAEEAEKYEMLNKCTYNSKS